MLGVLTNKNLQWCEPFNQLLSGGKFWQTWIKQLSVIHFTAGPTPPGGDTGAMAPHQFGQKILNFLNVSK